MCILLKAGSSKFDIVKNALAQISPEFNAFEVVTVINGTSVQPKKDVSVSVPVPTGFSNNIALYVISEAGTANRIEAVFDEENKALVAPVNTLGTIAIVDLSAELATDAPTALPTSGTTEVPTSLSTAAPGTDDPDNPDHPIPGSSTEVVRSNASIGSTVAIIGLSVYSVAVTIALIAVLTKRKK